MLFCEFFFYIVIGIKAYTLGIAQLADLLVLNVGRMLTEVAKVPDDV